MISTTARTATNDRWWDADDVLRPVVKLPSHRWGSLSLKLLDYTFVRLGESFEQSKFNLLDGSQKLLHRFVMFRRLHKQLTESLNCEWSTGNSKKKQNSTLTHSVQVTRVS